MHRSDTHRPIRSYENANCSFDALDFTVELNPFGGQADSRAQRAVLGLGAVLR